MRKRFAAITILALTALQLQCSKRENPVDPSDVPAGSYWSLSFSSQAISGDIMLSNPGRDVLVYTPPGYPEIDSLVFGDPQNPDSIVVTIVDYPVLYLLHGYGGNHNLFKGSFGLRETMDELINSGEIEPMIVVTPDASNKLGGSFYTNSYIPDSSRSFSGLFQDYITDEVVPLIDSVFHTLTDRQYRGIAGHSMGGYGAVMIAMTTSDLFASVASMSGLVAFSGRFPDMSDPLALGLMSLMPAMLAENNFLAGDTASFYSIAPGTGKSLTNMMFAMAAAFTPHDPSDPDTTYSHRFTVPGFQGHIDLPIDVNGQLVDSLWSVWLTHDVKTMLAAYSGIFDSTALYVDCGQADDLLLQYQAQAFIEAAGSAVDQSEIYSGFDTFFPADHVMYVGDRVREVVKFHDSIFRQ